MLLPIRFSADKRKIFFFVLCFVFPAIILFFRSPCSPFYIICNDSDSQVFMLVSNALKNGDILYKDVFDQKGPLWYLVYVLLQYITPYSFSGLYFLEVISAGFYYYYSYRAFDELYNHDFRRSSVSTIVICSVFMFSSFLTCGKPDEFSLSFVAYSLYILVRLIKNDDFIKLPTYFVIGIHMGILFWFKFTLMLFYVGCCIYLLLFYRKNLLKGLCLAVSGMIVVSVPVVLYFYFNDALFALVDVYFSANLFDYHSSSMSFFERLFSNFARFFVYRDRGFISFCFLFLLIGFIFGKKYFHNFFERMNHHVLNHRRVYLLILLSLFASVPVLILCETCYLQYHIQSAAVFLFLLGYFIFDSEGLFSFGSRFNDFICRHLSLRIVLVSMLFIFESVNVYVGISANVLGFGNLSIFCNDDDLLSDFRYRVADYMDDSSDLLVFGAIDFGFHQASNYCHVMNDYYIMQIGCRSWLIGEHYLDLISDHNIRYVLYRKVDGVHDFDYRGTDVNICDFIVDNGYNLVFNYDTDGVTWYFYDLNGHR